MVFLLKILVLRGSRKTTGKSRVLGFVITVKGHATSWIHASSCLDILIGMIVSKIKKKEKEVPELQNMPAPIIQREFRTFL